VKVITLHHRYFRRAVHQRVGQAHVGDQFQVFAVVIGDDGRTDVEQKAGLGFRQYPSADTA
jgi:hypothetical protein